MKRSFLIVFLMLSGIVSAQERNTIVDAGSRAMLVGYCDREALLDSNFAWWYNYQYENYEINKEELDVIPEDLEFIDISIVMGTWCGDSRREVPRFYKILDYLDYPDEKVTLITVNRDKVGLEDEVEGLDIKFVPTFIIYKDGEEIGRIIEAPVFSLEKDFTDILQGKN